MEQVQICRLFLFADYSVWGQAMGPLDEVDAPGVHFLR